MVKVTALQQTWSLHVQAGASIFSSVKWEYQYHFPPGVLGRRRRTPNREKVAVNISSDQVFVSFVMSLFLLQSVSSIPLKNWCMCTPNISGKSIIKLTPMHLPSRWKNCATVVTFLWMSVKGKHHCGPQIYYELYFFPWYLPLLGVIPKRYIVKFSIWELYLHGIISP